MILGIGVDIVEISRIKEARAKHPGSFERKVFTEKEIKMSGTKIDPNPFLAGRWAAKEAFVKALGCGIGPECYWLDINIDNTENGQPQISLSGRAANFAAKHEIKTIHVSISHEKNYACAMVVLEV